MITETTEGLKIIKKSDGSDALQINSARIDDCIEYLYTHNLKSIDIDKFQGFESKDLSFLERLDTFIETIVIAESNLDISIVNKLHKLKRLGFLDNKKDVIDLSNFPELESLSSEFSPRLKGLERCSNLKHLTLTSYKSKNKDLSDLPALPLMQSLWLFKTDIISLHGISKFMNLTELEVFRAFKLETIADLRALAETITSVSIEQCKKIKDFEILGELPKLTTIRLSESGEITSLSFIKSLPNLKFLSFWGTNVLDGNLAYCEGLSHVGFNNKRHYSHKVEYFNQIKNAKS